uniref:Uncharacterized protein n=2 Tax=Coptotermes formosanus TaxID=36987 RepID=R4V516_COPFO|nr:hypothetical protein [Coptotermes formosanus]
MAVYNLVIGIFTVLLVYVHTGLAISCYDCNSHNDSRCKPDPPPDDLKKDCADLARGVTYTMCRKIVQHIDFEVNGNPPEVRVIRGCGWDESQYVDKCYQRSGFGGRQEVCSCRKEYCNNSVAVSASLTLTTCTGLLLFLSRLLLF